MPDHTVLSISSKAIRNAAIFASLMMSVPSNNRFHTKSRAGIRHYFLDVMLRLLAAANFSYLFPSLL